MIKLTQTLIFPKITWKNFEEKKHWYHEKCTQSTFPMPKDVTQIGTDDWTRDKREVVV